MTSAADSNSREVLTWPDFGSGTRELAQRVADSGFRPEIILAIARGGLLPAGALGYALSVKNVFVMNVEYYSGIDTRLDFPVMLPPLLNQIELKDQHVLIVDDVADTGHTLKAVHDFCVPVVADVRNAVLYEKPHSIVKCEYVWRRTDRWIDFPWSDKPPVLAPKAEGATDAELEGH
jgi:hypoxanthine phosphoribosyltransferase